MAKHKKKKHHKKDDLADDVFSGAALTIRKFRQVTDEIAKLSSGQKVVGGLTLLAAGLVYLNKMKNEPGGVSFPDFGFHLPQFTAGAEPTERDAGSGAEEAEPPRKARKAAKPGKARPRRPAASPDADDE